MSLDVHLSEVVETEVFWSNITHNLGDMARESGIYRYVWRPEELGIKTAGELIAPLSMAIKNMKENPELFKKHDSENGWGTYEQFLPWLEEYLEACINNPDAKIEVSR